MFKNSQHKTSPVNVSVRNTKGVESNLTECPIDTRPTYSHFLCNRRRTHTTITKFLDPLHIQRRFASLDQIR